METAIILFIVAIGFLICIGALVTFTCICAWAGGSAAELLIGIVDSKSE